MNQTSREATKQMRQVLRQVQNHIVQANLNFGAQLESIGFVDVIHHPSMVVPHFNYVTPRKNTAWVGGQAIEKGIQSLKEHGHRGRICFVEGLFPPKFANTLHQLGLELEAETPIMIHKLERTEVAQLPEYPRECQVIQADDQEKLALWWYVWQNAYYDVVVSGVEPVYVGQSMRAVAQGQQIDLVFYQQGFPLGVALITVYEQSAHLMAWALMKEAREPEMIGIIYNAAIRAAAQRGCHILFMAGETNQERQIARKLGFIDAGSIVCYAEATDIAHEENDEALEQPVFILR